MKELFLVLALAVSACASPATAQTTSAPSQGAQAAEPDAERLRAIVQGGAVMPRRPSGCTSPESRQFDFWVGEWDVSPGQSQVVIADSVVALHDQGCTIIENWRPFRNAHGHSVNAYDATERKWRQLWSDASGRVTQYSGGLDEAGVMRLDNLSQGTGGRQRMNFQHVDANTVRQWGEHYDQAQRSWVTDWEFTYRRRGPIQ